MNKVFKKTLDYSKKELLTPQELADAANFMTTNKPFQAKDYDSNNENNRLAGDHCNCCGNGEFVLEMTDDEIQTIGIDNYSEHGGKRWIRCIKCGGTSHL